MISVFPLVYRCSVAWCCGIKANILRVARCSVQDQYSKCIKNTDHVAVRGERFSEDLSECIQHTDSVLNTNLCLLLVSTVNLYKLCCLWKSVQHVLECSLSTILTLCVRCEDDDGFVFMQGVHSIRGNSGSPGQREYCPIHKPKKPNPIRKYQIFVRFRNPMFSELGFLLSYRRHQYGVDPPGRCTSFVVWGLEEIPG